MFIVLTCLAAGACGPGHGHTVVRIIDGTAQKSRFVSPSAYLHYTRARIALNRGLLSEAALQLEQALVFDPGSPYLLTQLASVKARKGQRPQGLDLLKKVLDQRPDYPEALRLRAQLLWRMRRPGAAESTLRHCSAKNPGFAPCTLTHVALLERTARLEEARPLLERLLKHAPRSREGRRRLGVTCMRLTDFPCAARELGLALGLKWDLETALARARVLRAMGDHGRALPLLRETQARAGNSLAAARELLLTLELAGEDLQYKEQLDRLVRSAGAPAGRLRPLTELLLEVGNPRAALQALDAAEPRDASPDLILLRGRTLARTERKQEARQQLTGLLAGAHGTRAALHLADLLAHQGDLSQAQEVLSGALARAPGDEALLLAMARLQSLAGAASEGVKLLRGHVRAGEVSADLRRGLARALEEAGETTAALREARRALLSSSSTAASHHQVGRLLLAAGDDMDLAEEHLRRALQLAPTDPTYLCSLGWLHHQGGRLDRAREVIRMAHHLSPKDARILGRLAQVNAALGRHTLAARLYRQAMVVSQEARLTKDLQAQLGALLKRLNSAVK